MLRSVLVLTVVGLLCRSSVVRADDESPKATNLDVMRALATKIAGSCLDTLSVQDAPKFRLRVLPAETGWVLEEAIRAGLAARGARPADATYDRLAEFGILDMRVLYDDLRRDGFMGAKIVERTVSVTLHASITDSAATRVLFSGDRSASVSDTVLVSEISRLESSMLPMTRGTIPEEGFLDNIAGPFIVLGAVAVAVILLFTVRS
jgi:hypothetical protein